MSSPDSAPSADRNLLFGILALQMDFVSRDALIKAMHAWVLQKATPLGQILLSIRCEWHKYRRASTLQKATPLGQILLDQGALRDDTHALLQALVQKHLEMHAGDAQKSLASVSSLSSARQQLEQIADAELNHSLAHVAAARAVEDDPFATKPPSAGVPTSVGQRFRILRPHAEGGLGRVFVAHDEELSCEVALKEIKDRLADDKNNRSRFVLEAEITGGLEHPGIVPVYGLGQYADGRPFYAMRFIRGDSLQDAITRFHRADTPGRDAGERTLSLRQLLARFLDVCNAIAYAHSRGVLHRDLKPGNVMLGKYGETLVVDWGLAKPLGRAEGATETMQGPLQPSSASGSAAGTTPYVSGSPRVGRRPTRTSWPSARTRQYSTPPGTTSKRPNARRKRSGLGRHFIAVYLLAFDLGIQHPPCARPNCGTWPGNRGKLPSIIWGPAGPTRTSPGLPSGHMPTPPNPASRDIGGSRKMN